MNFLKIENSIFKVLIELFIFNKVKRAKLKARFAKRHLKKYVDEVCKSTTGSDYKVFEDECIIWQYWHQGKENAPHLIQKCFESVEKFSADKRVNVLSFDTIKDYVELPKRYYDLLDAGKISIAHFSDILRLYLLEKYGGLWIDSTIYLTGEIPDDIINSDFCVLQKDPKTDNEENKMSCFLIRGKRGCANVKALKIALDKYWQENNFAMNYFMFEHISTMLSDKEGALKEEWERMPRYSAEVSGRLQKVMFETFDEAKWEALKKETCIHKLTYKKGACPLGGADRCSYFNYVLGDFKKKRVSVIIPTLQKNLSILNRLIGSLEGDEAVSEIILIDNSSKGYERKSDKLKVIVPKENIYVNPAWNLGVQEAKEDIIALLNDDIIIPNNFCKNVISQMTPDMGIVGFNSGDFVLPIENDEVTPKEDKPFLEKAKFMDLYFGIAMFCYKTSYYKIPDDMKITYGDVWLYHKNLRNGKKNYRISNQTICHWGSLSSSAKSLNAICKNDAKAYKKLMIGLKERLLSFDNIWDCFKIRFLGLTFKIPKLKPGAPRKGEI